ncbi:MAG: transposase [Bdellovibrionales bacterium]
MKQQNLFKFSKIALPSKDGTSFGGELSKGKRKSRRPLDVKKPLHLVLRVQVSRPGTGSLFKNQTFINEKLKKFAKKFGIAIYGKAIVSNHIHLVLKFSHRLNYISFIRSVAGVLAKTLNVKWTLLPFTRIVTWGRDFKNTLKYVLQNELEALGIIDYQPRKRRRLL